MKGKSTYDEIVKWANIFLSDGNKFYGDGNKAAGVRARKALDQIAKLKVQWRKETC